MKPIISACACWGTGHKGTRYLAPAGVSGVTELSTLTLLALPPAADNSSAVLFLIPSSTAVAAVAEAAAAAAVAAAAAAAGSGTGRVCIWKEYGSGGRDCGVDPAIEDSNATKLA